MNKEEESSQSKASKVSPFGGDSEGAEENSSQPKASKVSPFGGDSEGAEENSSQPKASKVSPFGGDSEGAEENSSQPKASKVSPFGGDLEGAIRTATIEDCPRMMELIKELALYEKALNQVTVPYDHFVESGFGPNPVWWAFVAEVDGTVQGFALYFIRYRTWKGQCIFLEDFVVSEKYRGRGIGKLLFDKVIEEGKAKGYMGMVWQVLEWNAPGINFYNKYDGVQFNKEWIDCMLVF